MDFVACFGLLWIALVLTSLEYLQEVKIRSTLHPPVSIYGGKNPKLNGQKMWKMRFASHKLKNASQIVGY